MILSFFYGILILVWNKGSEIAFYFKKESQHLSSITHISEVGLVEGKLSLEEFCQLSQQHLVFITQTQQSLQEVNTLFEGKGDILPIHCSAALESLDKMNEHLREFEELLYNTTYLPVVITALCHQTLFILHRIEKHFTKLEGLLNDYFVICFTSSRHAKRLRIEIVNDNEKLLQYLGDYVVQTKLLNDEARFEEQSMLLFAEKK